MKPLDPVKEALAVTALKESLSALGAADDDTLLIDSIEGETNFFEAVDRILDHIADDQALADAAATQIDELRARKDRFLKRAEMKKALIEQAFLEADLPKVERPRATLFLSNRPPKVIVETESEIPARYWKAGEPKLDQKQLLADLKARREVLAAIPEEPGEARDAALAALQTIPEIPGATLSNGGRSLSIRTA